MSESIKLSSYLTEKLVFLQEQFTTTDELFASVHQVAFDAGYVREDFLPRVTDREATFPTGIQLEKMGVAIPHTDAECILKEFVAVVVNQAPVPFKSMEDLNQTVQANIVFVLGINQPHAQLEMLQSLMGLLQNEELLAQLCQSETATDLLNLVQQHHL